MKRVTRFLLLIFFFVVLSSSFGTAEAFNQNPNLNIGNTGSLEGVLPPPGFYLSLYNVYYSADDFRDNKGDKMAGTNTIDIVAVAPQFYYISSKKIFGLTPGIQAICNAVSLDVNSDLGIDSGRSGFGGLTVGPFLGSNFNITEKSKLFWNVEFDVYFPTGRYDADASVNPSANFYTFEPWVNFTWLLPHGFEISSRLHYTYNMKNDDFHHPLLGTQSYDMKPGQAFHLNYAATKTLFSENFRLGVKEIL